VTGLLPFLVEQLENSGAQLCEQPSHCPVQDDVALFVQMSFMLVIHGPSLHPVVRDLGAPEGAPAGAERG
jgi:hypothetical protein